MNQGILKVLKQIESTGKLDWKDTKGKQQKIELGIKARRLVMALADEAQQREAAEEEGRKRTIPEEQLFNALDKLWSEETQVDRKDAEHSPSITQSPKSEWLLKRVQTSNFGGINGPLAIEPFEIEIDTNATCFLGGNGSGKTSLISSITWALTGKRIADHSGLTDLPNYPQPLFDRENPTKQIGTWPPIATYPASAGLIATKPSTSVTLTFIERTTGETAQITRVLSKNGDGKTEENWPTELASLKDCLDTAVEMPLRIGQLRFGEDNRLNDVVANFTGLSVLATLGELVTWLIRSNNPFRNTPKESEHSARETRVKEHLQRAIANLPTLKAKLEPLQNLHEWVKRSDEHSTTLRTLTDDLVRTAASDLEAIKEFVGDNIDLQTEEGQRTIANAVASANTAYEAEHLKAQFARNCTKLSQLSKISQNSADLTRDLADAFAHASKNLDQIIHIHRRRTKDKKLRLKAVAAETHSLLHGNIPISFCILCERDLDTDELKALGKEIEALKAESNALTETLKSNCQSASESLNKIVEPILSTKAKDAFGLAPTEEIEEELRALLVTSHGFVKSLPIFAKIFEDALTSALIPDLPPTEFYSIEASDLEAPDKEIVGGVLEAISGVRHSQTIATWAPSGVAAFRDFYKEVLGAPTEEGNAPDATTLHGMCDILNEIVNRAKPAQTASAELQQAIIEADVWFKDEQRRSLHAEISGEIEPLKLLPSYVESEVDKQLTELSDRISEFVGRYHSSALLAFQRARLEREGRKRKGLIRARAALKTKSHPSMTSDESDYEVDATFISNTSWMRALLWAFLFALRERRATMADGLPLPLLLMDDPQTTFDLEHRCAWIDFVLSVEGQNGLSPSPQVILSTYDDTFAHHIELLSSHVPVREIAASLRANESLFVNGTELVDRLWAKAEETRSNADASASISELRKHLEQLVKSIFPPALSGKATTFGELMTELKSARARFPYDGTEVQKLIAAWEEPSKDRQRKALSEVHHNNQPIYDFKFAKEVFAWFRGGLKAHFHSTFKRLWRIREAGWNIPQSGMAATSQVSKMAIVGTTIMLPANVNKVVARVAAETDGREVRIIDNQPSIHFVSETLEIDALASKELHVLTAATLEPTAQIGDALITSATLPPTENSLIISHADGAWRARRFGLLGTAAFNSVLVASAVNPREIRRPILVPNKQEAFRKIVGIIYRRGWSVPDASEDEIAPFENPQSINSLLQRSVGLARVVGESAEPIALNGQYLILAPQLSGKQELTEYDGRPIVVDQDGRILFKRLRLRTPSSSIVLESLDAAGRFPPVVISHKEVDELAEKLKFTPVLGVLFDSQIKR